MYSESIVSHNAAIAELILTMLTALGMSGFCIGIVIILLRYAIATRQIFTIKRIRHYPIDYLSHTRNRNKRLSRY